MSHVCTCGDCAEAPFSDCCKHEVEAERLLGAEQRYLDMLQAEKREVEGLRTALWECVKLTGADTSDGPPRPGTGDWPQLPELAVREVARLRQEYDEETERLEELAEARLSLLHRERTGWLAETEQLRKVKRAARVYYREFDHLIPRGINREAYPEQRDLRDALGGN